MATKPVDKTLWCGFYIELRVGLVIKGLLGHWSLFNPKYAHQVSALLLRSVMAYLMKPFLTEGLSWDTTRFDFEWF